MPSHCLWMWSAGFGMSFSETGKSFCFERLWVGLQRFNLFVCYCHKPNVFWGSAHYKIYQKPWQKQYPGRQSQEHVEKLMENKQFKYYCIRLPNHSTRCWFGFHFNYFFNTIFVSSHMYPENPEETRVIVVSVNVIWYLSNTARNRTRNLFHPKCMPIPLGHSDDYSTLVWNSICKFQNQFFFNRNIEAVRRCSIEHGLHPTRSVPNSAANEHFRKRSFLVHRINFYANKRGAFLANSRTVSHSLRISFSRPRLGDNTSAFPNPAFQDQRLLVPVKQHRGI